MAKGKLFIVCKQEGTSRNTWKGLEQRDRVSRLDMAGLDSKERGQHKESKSCIRRKKREGGRGRGRRRRKGRGSIGERIGGPQGGSEGGQE